MDAKTTFSQILGSYWEKVGVPRVNKLSKDTTVKELEEMLAISRDCTVDGIEFVWKDLFIDSHDQDCVKGTIMDIYDERSMIFAFYKKYLRIIKCLIQEKQNQPVHFSRVGCKKHCIGCENRDINVCIKEMQGLSTDLFKIGGLRDKILQAADKEWKIHKQQ